MPNLKMRVGDHNYPAISLQGQQQHYETKHGQEITLVHSSPRSLTELIKTTARITACEGKCVINHRRIS